MYPDMPVQTSVETNRKRQPEKAEGKQYGGVKD